MTKVCHRFTAALMTGRSVISPGVQPYDAAEIAALSVPCIGSACALWVADTHVYPQGICADNAGPDARPWPDPAKAERLDRAGGE